jgi:hypothetical protein
MLFKDTGHGESLPSIELFTGRLETNSLLLSCAIIIGSRRLTNNLNAFACGALSVEIAEALCHWADVTIADLAVVDLRHGG